MKKKYFFWIVVSIIVILILTNPTLKDYKEYLPTEIGISSKYYTVGRKTNYLIFSIYRSERRGKIKHHIGICKNFYLLWAVKK